MIFQRRLLTIFSFDALSETPPSFNDYYIERHCSVIGNNIACSTLVITISTLFIYTIGILYVKEI